MDNITLTAIFIFIIIFAIYIMVQVSEHLENIREKRYRYSRLKYRIIWLLLMIVLSAGALVLTKTVASIWELYH